ncbi:hypothetical protein WJX81_002266 [Elliptochloris bilobata]|uniref:Uncharacterized protein n=1 Tax=Elliptochloris bilobata TaxID=381761 RepID=A0AAW1QV85_9CHLO
MGLAVDDFNTQYVQDGEFGKAVYKPLRKNAAGNACVFLDGSLCSVYTARPAQCRMYPSWPEQMRSPHDWEAEGMRCEGIHALPNPRHTAHSPASQGNASQAQGSGHAAQDAGDAAAGADVVPAAEVVANLALEKVRRSGGMRGMPYSDMRELLEEAGTGLAAKLAAEHFAAHERAVMHESARLRVLQSREGAGPGASYTRSLVFLDAPGYAQTEAPHRGLALALAFRAARVGPSAADAGAAAPLRLALIGSGAGALPMALREAFSNMAIDAVEPDAEVAEAAERFFGVPAGDARLLLHYDVVIVDAAVAHPLDGARILALPPGLLSDGAIASLRQCLRPHGVAAVHVAGGPAALDAAARSLSRSLGAVHALSTPQQGILFAAAGDGMSSDESVAGEHGTASARCSSGRYDVPLWRLAAAAEAIPALQSLCGEQLLRGWLRAWALDDSLHAFVRAEGYGWLPARELPELAACSGLGCLESR